MIGVLSKRNTGIIIENNKYNVLCYADDILLSSTAIYALQMQASLFSNPKWYIDDEELVLSENVNYLGPVQY